MFSLFLSCSDEGNPLVSQGDDHFFFTIDEGTLLTNGMDVQVSYSENNSQADKVVILLKDSDLSEIAVVEVSPDDLKGDGLPISFPNDLSEGLYLLCFEVWDGDILLSESEVYFYIVSGEYAVDGIETYPSDIETGEFINAKAYLFYPDGNDPWIRWSLNSTVLKEGFISSMEDTCLFTAPEETGVYSLKAELFPVEPQADHSSSAVFYSDLFVNPGDGNPLEQAEKNIYTFFVAFDSGLKDIQNPDESPEILGNPEEERDGYVLNSEDGIRYHYNTLPLDQNGNVQNFTLSLDFNYEDLPSSDEWRLITIGDEDSNFILFYNGNDEAFYAGFSGAADSLSSLSKDFLPESGSISLDLIYSSEGGVKKLLWVLQEEVLQQSPVGDFVLPEDGDTLVGSDQIIPGLPLLWFSVGVSEADDGNSSDISDSSDTALSGGESSTDDNQMAFNSPTTPLESGVAEILYERKPGKVNEILVKDIPLDFSLFTMEIILDKNLPAGDWSFSFQSEDGVPYYSFDYLTTKDWSEQVESNPELFTDEEDGDILILSFVSNEDGLFLSRDKLINGPFPSQKSLNFSIVAYNSEEYGLNSIKEIRLYQD